MNTFVPPEYVSVPKVQWDEQQAEIERLRMLIVKYEALAAAARGTLEAPQDEAPFTVIDAPSDTPR